MTDATWIVMKYGGTSVSTRERWETIAAQCAQHVKDGYRVLVVCSAISGISNQLEAVSDLAVVNQHEANLAEIRNRHLEMAKALDVDYEATCGSIFGTLERVLKGSALLEETSIKQRARIMSSGELLSTKLGVAFLRHSQEFTVCWADARVLMRARHEPNLPMERQVLSATCDDSRDPTVIHQLEAMDAQVVVTQGFIASAKEGHTVLLGRGGSDTSATYFGAKLNAERVEIWTDVPGMFTANPRKVPSARLLRHLSYQEAQEIASTGAKVLHPRCIAPARRHQIPIHIRCTPAPEMEGTIIDRRPVGGGPQVKAMSVRLGVTLISMETVGMWHQVGFLADVFQVFKTHGLSVDLVSTSETNVTVSLDAGTAASDGPAVKALLKDLSQYCRATSIGPCAAVSMVGNRIRGLLHRLGPALEVFEEQVIHLVSQAASDLNLTFVVEERQADRLVAKLHDLLISPSSSIPSMGPTWAELFSPAPTEPHSEDLRRWWHTRADDLIELGGKSPAYVYHLPTVQRQAQQLLNVPQISRLFYAIKANSNPDVLRTLAALQIGFECVSPGEVQRVMESIPDLNAKRILFTPNFAPKEEYQFGFEANVFVTLDNVYPLEAWPEVFRGREIILRMDPGEGRGHHEHVKTAGKKSKFGISISELERVKQLATDCGAVIVGLHAHAGSGIRNPDNWRQTGLFLAQIAQEIPTVKHIDVGGGLGVVEKPGEAPLDTKALSESLQQIKDAYPNLEIWMEPGRYFVAESGVLLTTVTQTKQKGDVSYIGVNAGMNVLIRPALYGAWHDIVNLNALGAKRSVTANIVGPICESGDTLGHKRTLPSTKEGDVLLVDVAGAYGFSMSSNYNLRGDIGEIILDS